MVRHNILTGDFTLDMANFVAPGHAKISAHWEDGFTPGEPGAPIRPVMRGGHFESVTIGKMPGRQVILYNKRGVAIDLKQPYWFKAWGVDRDDPARKVWRVEILAGKTALEKGHVKRSFEAIDADFAAFLRKAMHDIRYVIGKEAHSNVSRATTHPLWVAAASALERLPVTVAPPMPEARVLDLLRKQRRDMNIRNAFGNAINALVLDGTPPEHIEAQFSRLVFGMADRFVKSQADRILLRKITDAEARSKFFLSPDRAKPVNM